MEFDLMSSQAMYSGGFPVGYRREGAFRLVIQFDRFSSWLYVGGVSVGYIKRRVTSSYKVQALYSERCFGLVAFQGFLLRFREFFLELIKFGNIRLIQMVLCFLWYMCVWGNKFILSMFKTRKVGLKILLFKMTNQIRQD